MRESTVERALVREVKRAGGEVRKFITPGRRHAPDRLVLWPAQVVRGIAFEPARVHFVELKAPGKKARAGQEREHARLRKMGFSVHVISTVEMVDVYVRFCQ